MCDIESNAGHAPDTLSGAMADMHDQVADAQHLCMRCGMCCDGTLFERASLAPTDEPALLEAAAIIPLSATEGKHFSLPCHHHQNRVCTIYESWRPHVCHAFRCRLLRRYDAGEISLAEAIAVVTRTTALADRVWAQLRERIKGEQRSLVTLFRAWEGSQAEAGAAWRREQAAFLLDCASLQVRLDRDFRLKPNQEVAEPS